MIKGLWGKKIGMTQVFSNEKVVPVTAIDLSNWLITQIKTENIDGYTAVQVGKIKDRYSIQDFSAEWLKKPKKYFSLIKEVRTDEPVAEEIKVGQPADPNTILSEGDLVDVMGISIGKGFAGVVKRHGFAGGRASHGGRMGRATGSLSFMRSQGKVIKGKKMPGHLGQEQKVTKSLEVIKLKPEANVVFVKGSIPGKSGSFVFVKKR